MPLESGLSLGEGRGFGMKRLGVKRDRLAAAAVVLALLAAGGALAFAVTAGAAPQSALQETTVPPPTDTGPTPDPAPAPKPAPKPTPKTTPTPTPTHRTYTAPRTYTPPKKTYTAPTYTAPRVTVTHSSTRHVAKKHQAVVHKKKKAAAKKPAVTTSIPVETTPQPAVLGPVVAKQTRSSSGGDQAVTSVLFIAGVTFAALLFLLAAAVPGTPARFTPVGRIVFEHQQDLVLVGVAAFLVTVFVYVLTGHGL